VEYPEVAGISEYPLTSPSQFTMPDPFPGDRVFAKPARSTDQPFRMRTMIESEHFRAFGATEGGCGRVGPRKSMVYAMIQAGKFSAPDEISPKAFEMERTEIVARILR
jgi:hypothetical protein